jgi:hypothetical protein
MAAMVLLGERNAAKGGHCDQQGRQSGFSDSIHVMLLVEGPMPARQGCAAARRAGIGRIAN